MQITYIDVITHCDQIQSVHGNFANIIIDQKGYLLSEVAGSSSIGPCVAAAAAEVHHFCPTPGIQERSWGRVEPALSDP